jgi:transcription elongation factor GreA
MSPGRWRLPRPEMVVFTHTAPGRPIGPWLCMTVHLTNDYVSRKPGEPPAKSNGRSGYTAGAALMTAASLAELRVELEQLRKRTRIEIAQRLREARSYGDGSNNDDYHAVREEQMVLEAKIASVEQTVARATVVTPDDAGHGVAAIGSSVSIQDLGSGETSHYQLSSAHRSVGSDVISAASPMGRALIGALPGAIVTVDLPSGRSRSARLVDVATEPPSAACSAERDSV